MFKSFRRPIINLSDALRLDVLGLREGPAVGLREGPALGPREGSAVGLQEGPAVGLREGPADAVIVAREHS